MLKTHEKIWDDRLSTLNVTEHRIEIKDGVKPAFMQPYRRRPKTREEERKQIRQMREQDVNEPSASEWAVPVEILPKPKQPGK